MCFQGEAPTRRGPWRQKASLSISVPKGQRAKPSMQPSKKPQNNKITHNLSLNNINLAPGEAKVIRQTLVVRRRRPNANKKRTNSKSPSNRKRGGSQQGFATRFVKGSGQRDASPSALQSHNSFLLSKLHPTQKTSVQMNGMATIHLPVVDLNGAVPAGQFSGSGNTGNTHVHHGNRAPTASDSLFGASHIVDNTYGGFPGSRFGGGSPAVKDFTHSGVKQVDIASALLLGNPEVVVFQDTASTPVPVSTADGLGPLPATGHGSAYSAAFHVRAPAAAFRITMPAHAAHNTPILSSSLIGGRNFKQNILSTSLIRDSNYMPNILSTSLIGGSNYNQVQYSNQASGNSKLNSQRKTNSVIEKHTPSPAHTTVEPGEDPPELK